jgi:hypothetical protein
MTRIVCGKASCNATSEGEVVWLSHLEGHGDAGDLLSLLRSAQALAHLRQVYLIVDEDNPRKEQILRAYKKAGMNVIGTVLRIGGN